MKAEVQSQTTDDLAAELVTLLALAGDNAGTRWEQFSPAQQDLVLQYLKPNLYKQGKKVKLVAFKDVFVKFAPPPFTNPFSTSAATGYSISNVKRGWTTRYTLATSVSGNAPSCCQSTLSLTSQYGWSNSFNANVGVSAQVVTAGIGFDVTLSGSSTYQY
ncbi:hypothetical protein F8S13_11435 [Chloroflexia bacterium SDU3-3]|nr:hypothetical protein F8S13_11435 [Chloroflexia bacterium SDU3-3]